MYWFEGTKPETIALPSKYVGGVPFDSGTLAISSGYFALLSPRIPFAFLSKWFTSSLRSDGFQDSSVVGGRAVPRIAATGPKRKKLGALSFEPMDLKGSHGMPWLVQKGVQLVLLVVATLDHFGSLVTSSSFYLVALTSRYFRHGSCITDVKRQLLVLRGQFCVWFLSR